MSKWKCDICGAKFDNFHAQGFDNKIYCPLCFYKHEFDTLNKGIDELIKKYEDKITIYTESTNLIDKIINDLKKLKGE